MAKQTKTKYTRSTKGCSECRSKRRACDELKPSCTRCTSQGKKCIYKVSLKFKDSSCGNTAFGREGIWRKTKDQNRTLEDLCRLASDLKYLRDVKYKGEFHFINSNSLFYFAPPMIRSRHAPLLSNELAGDSSAIQYGLSYFKENVSLIFNPLLIEKNQALDFGAIVQYSQRGAIHLLYLLISIGCRHLSKTNDFWEGQARRFKQVAHQEFIKRATPFTKKSELLLYTLLLCLYDLADDCDNHWSKNIRTAKWLVENIDESDCSNSVEATTLKFSHDFFGYQEAMGRTACRKTNLFSIDTWGNDNSLIPWMGCSKKLVGVISDITDLTYEKADSRLLPSELQSMIEKLDFKLGECLTYTENDLFNIGCNCKVQATRIYLSCSLLGHSPGSSFIKTLVKQLANKLSMLIIDKSVKWQFLLWPLFILGCEIDPFDEDCEYLRKLTLQMFQLLQARNLGNSNEIRASVSKIWCDRDLQANNQKILNDWEMYIADNSLNLSLA